MVQIKKTNHQISKLLGNFHFVLPINAIILFCILGYNPFTASAITKETVESLIEVNRVLDQPIELHLTSSDLAMVSSTVSLENEDAWLFFDNIKPSDVISKFAGYIYIGENKLANGVNGRVAIYAHGTVIMAHGSGFKPLTVYTEENLGGTSQKLDINTYYKNLGELDNKIKSFRLKRGYMATMATNSDGSGYSRVFIADKEDIVFNVMPDELNGTISFIRIFKHQWVTKKGWGGWNAVEYDMVNITSRYDWNVGGTTEENFEYVPMRWGSGWPSWTDINAKQNVTHLLGYNEPDQSNQANMTFQQMIDGWPGMMNSGLRIGSPAYANAWGGNGGNLFDFIKKCDELNYRVDFVALHCYWGGKSAINWYNDLKYIHEATGRPLWITEWNNGANWTTEWWPDASRTLTDANAKKQLNDIKAILQVLDTASFIERYYIYNWVEDCRAMVLNGELTPAGEYYAANKSQIAYNSANEVVHQWNYIAPELSYKYISLKKSIRLEWENPNMDLCKEFKVEKKINNGAYESIYTNNNMAVLYYLDSIKPEISGTITYRLSVLKADGNYLTSNEVSIFQTSAIDSVQVGKFQLNNFDWSTSFYSKEYSSAPLVFLGIPTINNAMPFTKRVAYVTTNYFKFHFEPWKYNSSTSLTKKDVISTMCLPSGIYNFNGLKAEAKAVSDIARDWVSVTFDEEFSQNPVVFCSVVTSNSQYPLTVAVKNVTKTGFEMRLKTEEAISGIIIPEIVNYFAIEPGNGSIEGKRITVGQTSDGNGISSIPMEIAYDSTYTAPVLFAGLLSDENTNAVTLRYSNTSDSTIKISKQRELSGSLTSIKADAMGWMIMDISDGQVINSVNDNRFVNEKLIIYPNPSDNLVYFNLNKLAHVEIYNINGQKILDDEVFNKIDVSSLPTGIYLIKINNTVNKLIIK